MRDHTLPPDWETITDFISGTLSGEERGRFEARLAAEPVLAAQVNGMRAALAVVEPLGPALAPATQIDRVLTNLAQRLQVQDEATSSSAVGARSLPRPTVWRRPSSVWAGACGIAVLGVAAIALVTRDRPAQGNAPQVYATASGQTAVMRLDDGTRVSLAPESRMEIAQHYGATHRTVALSGEAFFEVPASGGIPFVVRTGTTTTRVLGTAFSVRQYEGDAAVQVRVQSGRVSATSRRASVIVSAGEVAHVTDSIAVTGAADAIYTDWGDRHLVFRNARVGDILVGVGRWYGYRFRLDDSVLVERVTIEFAPSDPTEMFLALRTLLNVNVVMGDEKTREVRLVPIRDRQVPRGVMERRDQFKPSREMGR